MNTQFERSACATDEWYTPKEIIDALGEFDLDLCAPANPLWQTAKVMYNKNVDGLKQEWKGRVWLNPPYSRMETVSLYFSIAATQRCFKT